MADADVASNPVDEADLANPTFEEAYDKASSSLKDKEEKEPQAEPEAKVEEKSETKPEQQEEETPLDKFDPEKLPDELKPLYKNLMKGFTQGRQKDREELNTLREELKALQTKDETTVNPEETKNLTPEEYIDKVVKEKVTQEKVSSFREQALNDYDSLDPRLHKAEDNQDYDSIMDSAIGSQLDKLLEEHVQENGSELGFDYKSHAKDLIGKWDGYVKKQIDSYLGKQREMAKKQERSFTRSNPKGGTAVTKPSGNMSLEQAISAAIKRSQE